MRLEGRVHGSGVFRSFDVLGGCIKEIGAERARLATEARWLAPGFFDLQVNGFAGVDFCNPKLTVQDIETAARAILATGTTRFLPTIITALLDDMRRELAVLARAIE